MARSFRVPGDQLGNQSHGFGWPYGPFPVKIPTVQLMGALYMGIKLVLRVDKKSEFLRHINIYEITNIYTWGSSI
ncbi:putative L-glutamate gamma-semialdehyde dehydrogenase [Helianthus anomalus]